jgi:multiple sugar transport system permease protein
VDYRTVTIEGIARPRPILARFRLRHGPLPYLLPAVLYLFALTIFPLIYSLYLSFQRYTPRTASLSSIGLANFAELLSDPIFLVSLRNTLVFTIAVTCVELLLGLMVALFFDRDFVGKDLARTALIIPMLTTPMVVGLMWRFLLNADWGIVNWLLHFVGIEPINWVGKSPWSLISLMVVDIWQWTPFAFLMLYAGLQAVPHDLFEAATVDGATEWQKFRYVTLPLLKPLIAIVVIFRGVDAFRTFDTVFTLTYGGPGTGSYTLSFYAYLTGFSFLRVGYASAIAWVMVILVIVAVMTLISMLRRRGSRL